MHLREVEIFCTDCKTIGDATPQIGVAEQTYYRWIKLYSGMRMHRTLEMAKTMHPSHANISNMWRGVFYETNGGT